MKHRPPPHRGAPAANALAAQPVVSDQVVRELGAVGDGWRTQAWHARLWSYLLVEIADQVSARARDRRAPLERRARELEEYYPGSDEAIRIRERLGGRIGPECEIEDGKASVFMQIGEWPKRMDRRVSFALDARGELCAKAENTLPGRPKLTTVFIGKQTDDAAREDAARLVRAAIRLIVEDDDAQAPGLRG